LRTSRLTFVVRLGGIVAAIGSLAGCTTAYSVKIPLVERSAPAEISRVVLLDERAEKPDRVKLGNGLISCQRWYPDSTFQPSKVQFLHSRLAAHLPEGRSATVTLTKLDTVEFCDDSSSRASAAAVAGATGALGMPVIIPSAGVPNGDRFELRVAGSIDNTPFELVRFAGYSDLNVLTMPGTNPAYQQRVAEVFDAAAAEIVALSTAARTLP
jgi:hypothetical protein